MAPASQDFSSYVQYPSPPRSDPRLSSAATKCSWPEKRAARSLLKEPGERAIRTIPDPRAHGAGQPPNTSGLRTLSLLLTFFIEHPQVRGYFDLWEGYHCFQYQTYETCRSGKGILCRNESRMTMKKNSSCHQSHRKLWCHASMFTMQAKWV